MNHRPASSVVRSTSLSASAALASLREGNRRFVGEEPRAEVSGEHRAALVRGQAPKAIVLACADSRVPPEVVFDQGLGELFVVRVAGNVCAPSTLGSIEYAASVLGTELVVVMGHTRCGAVKATIDAVASGPLPRTTGSPSLDDIVERIAPAVERLVERGVPSTELEQVATRSNASLAADQIVGRSAVMRALVQQGRVTVVVAEYAVETGAVRFFDMRCHRDAVAA